MREKSSIEGKNFYTPHMKSNFKLEIRNYLQKNKDWCNARVDNRSSG